MEKISKKQIIILIVGCRIVTAYTNLPILKNPTANQDIWFITILSGVYVGIIYTPLLYLSNKFSDKNFIQYAEIIMGKMVGKILNLVIASFFIFTALVESVNLIQFLSSTIMPETPHFGFMLFMVIPCAYATFKGLEPITRTAEISIIYILVTIILFSILSFNKMNFREFLPILADSKIHNINLEAINAASKFTDLLILFMLTPNIYEKQSINSILLRSVAIFTIFYIIIVISVQAVMGIKMPQYINNPYYIYTRQVDIFDFIHHMEGINLLGWIIGMFIKFSTYLYIASQALAQIFRTKTNKGFILPIIAAIVITLFTTKITNASVLNDIFSDKVYLYIGLIVILVIPLFLLIIYSLKRKLSIDMKY